MPERVQAGIFSLAVLIDYARFFHERYQRTAADVAGRLDTALSRREHQTMLA